MQLFTVLLTVCLVTAGLGAFLGFQIGGSHPHMANVQACTPPSKDLASLPVTNQSNSRGTGPTVIGQIKGPAYRLMLAISTGKQPDTQLMTYNQIRPFATELLPLGYTQIPLVFTYTLQAISSYPLRT